MSLLERDKAVLVVVDVQEGFRSYASFDAVAQACSKLVRAGRILDVPRIVSEQYPKGLGHTAPEVGLEDEPRIEKTVFSAVRAEGFDLGGRTQAIVCGIETHVCVSQTAHDLLERGIEVHVPADAVGSRHELDYERGSGAPGACGSNRQHSRVCPVRAARASRHARLQGNTEAHRLMAAPETQIVAKPL